jgi:hypothetical protein
MQRTARCLQRTSKFQQQNLVPAAIQITDEPQPRNRRASRPPILSSYIFMRTAIPHGLTSIPFHEWRLPINPKMGKIGNTTVTLFVVAFPKDIISGSGGKELTYPDPFRGVCESCLAHTHCNNSGILCIAAAARCNAAAKSRYCHKHYYHDIAFTFRIVAGATHSLPA